MKSRDLKAIEFEGVTARLGAPKDWDPATQGECFALPVMQTEDGRCVSLWTLDDEQRAAIASGANIALHIVSGRTQPPVMLTIEPWDQPDPENATAPDWLHNLALGDVLADPDGVEWRAMSFRSYGVQFVDLYREDRPKGVYDPACYRGLSMRGPELHAYTMKRRSFADLVAEEAEKATEARGSEPAAPAGEASASARPQGPSEARAAPKDLIQE